MSKAPLWTYYLHLYVILICFIGCILFSNLWIALLLLTVCSYYNSNDVSMNHCQMVCGVFSAIMFLSVYVKYKSFSALSVADCHCLSLSVSACFCVSVCFVCFCLFLSVCLICLSVCFVCFSLSDCLCLLLSVCLSVSICHCACLFVSVCYNNFRLVCSHGYCMSKKLCPFLLKEYIPKIEQYFLDI